MQEQINATTSCPRLNEEYEEEDNECDDRNGMERLERVNEEIEEAMSSSDHKIHVTPQMASSAHDICNGHNYNSCGLSDDSRYDDRNSRVVPNNECNMGSDNLYPLSSETKNNRLERSESTLVSNYQKSKESGMRRVASCPGIYLCFLEIF
jgi:hypothetical protein